MAWICFLGGDVQSHPGGGPPVGAPLPGGANPMDTTHLFRRRSYAAYWSALLQL